MRLKSIKLFTLKLFTLIKTVASRILIFTALIGKASALIVIGILLMMLVNELIRRGTYLIIGAK